MVLEVGVSAVMGLYVLLVVATVFMSNVIENEERRVLFVEEKERRMSRLSQTSPRGGRENRFFRRASEPFPKGKERRFSRRLSEIAEACRLGNRNRFTNEEVNEE